MDPQTPPPSPTAQRPSDYEHLILDDARRELTAAVVLVILLAGLPVTFTAVVLPDQVPDLLVAARSAVGWWPSDDWDPIGAIGAIEGFVGATVIAAILAGSPGPHAGDAERGRLTMLDAAARGAARFAYVTTAAIAAGAATAPPRAVFVTVLASGVLAINCLLIGILGRRPWVTATSLDDADRLVAIMDHARRRLRCRRPRHFGSTPLTVVLGVCTAPATLWPRIGTPPWTNHTFVGACATVLALGPVIHRQLMADARVHDLTGAPIKAAVHRAVSMTIDMLAVLLFTATAVTEPASLLGLAGVLVLGLMVRVRDRYSGVTDALARDTLDVRIRATRGWRDRLAREAHAQNPHPA